MHDPRVTSNNAAYVPDTPATLLEEIGGLIDGLAAEKKIYVICGAEGPVVVYIEPKCGAFEKDAIETALLKCRVHRPQLAADPLLKIPITSKNTFYSRDERMFKLKCCSLE
jgi:hypothetical protein